LSTTIGERIFYARRAAGHTQISLAEAVGVTHGNVSLWETDQTKPRAKTVQRLAKALSVSIDWLERGAKVSGSIPQSIGAWEFKSNKDLASAKQKELLIPRLDVVSRENYVGEQNFKSVIPLYIETARQLSCSPKDLGALVVPDNLMSPVVGKGDVVVLDTSQNVIRNDENDVYLVRGNKRALALCRIVEDIFGYYLWFERDGRYNGKKISELQWDEFFIAGRVIYKSGFM